MTAWTHSGSCIEYVHAEKGCAFRVGLRVVFHRNATMCSASDSGASSWRNDYTRRGKFLSGIKKSCTRTMIPSGMSFAESQVCGFATDRCQRWCSKPRVCSAFQVSEFIFPSPYTIGESLVEYAGPIGGHALRTFWVTMAGFGIAVGVALGFLIGSSPVLYAAACLCLARSLGNTRAQQLIQT